MTDLERRVRAELSSRAEDAGPWGVGGAALRRTAGERRARRRRSLATAMVAVAVAAGSYVAVADRSSRDPGPDLLDPLPTAPPSPDPAWADVELTAGMYRRAVAAAGVTTSWRPWVATRVGRSRQVVVLLASEPERGGELSVATVTFGSDRPGAPVRSGTLGRYPSRSSLVAQPARFGDGAVLVVLLPPELGDTVQVTLSKSGEPLQRVSGFVADRLALVALPRAGPADVTRVQVLEAGRTAVDLVPAGSLLGDDVPRTLDRVVTRIGPEPQQVQVRTDGRSACRMTVGGWWDGPPHVAWNPFDTACAAVDGGMHLLLSDDRRYGSVAGIAPPHARSVRLHWAGGVVTESVTSGGDVNAFLGPFDRPADRLVRAEALDGSGQVVATAMPSGT